MDECLWWLSGEFGGHAKCLWGSSESVYQPVWEYTKRWWANESEMALNDTSVSHFLHHCIFKELCDNMCHSSGWRYLCSITCLDIDVQKEGYLCLTNRIYQKPHRKFCFCAEKEVHGTAGLGFGIPGFYSGRYWSSYEAPAQKDEADLMGHKDSASTWVFFSVKTSGTPPS